MLELVTHDTRSRAVERIPGIDALLNPTAKADQPELTRIPSLPRWQNYDLLAAAVTAADE